MKKFEEETKNIVRKYLEYILSLDDEETKKELEELSNTINMMQESEAGFKN